MMEGPKPPADPEQLNIIEKLADFVARNGQEFETYTKEKQRDNPKFAFLHGGEFYDFYKFKVEELRRRWPAQRPPTEYQQQMDYNYQWTENHPAGGDYHWEQQHGTYSTDYRHGYPPSTPYGWGGGDPDGNQWYPPQWSGGPAYPGGPGVPAMAPPYGQPPGMNMGGDGFRGPGFNMPPQFGYGGPPYQAPEFGQYGGDNFDYSSDAGAPEFSELDIEQSEKNLEAQHEALMARQASEIEDLLDRSLLESVQERANQHNLTLDQINEIIQPIIDACTKENISKGKTWVIERGSESRELADLITDYLLARAASREAVFDLRLHLVYLLNDLLHHCKRRGAPDYLQHALQHIVPVMFCLTAELADEEKRTKLNRVLDLWDSNTYLPPSVLEKMRPPLMETFMNNWKEDRKKAKEAEIDQIKATIDAEYRGLEQQHKEFADHVRRQLASSHPESEQHQADERTYDNWGPAYNDNGPDGPRGPFMPPHMPRGGYPPHRWPGAHRGPPPQWIRPPFPRPPFPPHEYGPPRGRMDGYVDSEESEVGYDRPYDRGYNAQYDNYRYDDRGRGDNRNDRSHRSSGRPSRFSSRHDRDDSVEEPRPHRQRGKDERDEEASEDAETVSSEPIDLEPKCPPWELPAGLMHSLIRLCDFDYTPLDGSKLRLLPPKAPTERLMAAIDNFYLPPSHDRTRDGEGWERLGLYEFYSKKERARDHLERLKHSSAGRNSERNHRTRKQSGGSGAASPPSGDESQSDLGQLDIDPEHTKPFIREGGGLRSTAHHLSHITAYPTAAIGQGIRTGLEALTAAPPPVVPFMAYPGYKPPIGPVLGPGGIAVPPPVMPGAPPGFPAPNFLQFPPPGMSQPPPTSAPPATGLIQRSVGGAGYSASRSRLESRRSRSGSKSRSGSRSGSDRSRGSSRSGSRSPRCRSGSRSPRGDGDNDKGDSRSSRKGRRKSSRSRSRSSSPRSRFTSAPGPGGIGSGTPSSSSLSAARAAAMAVAASITNSIKAKSAADNAGGRNARPSRFSGPPGGSQHPPGRSRSRFSSATPNPERVAEMHLLGEGPE